MFFWNSLAFFYDPMDVGNLISHSSTFSKSSFNFWKFLVHILLKLSLKGFEHYFASMWNGHTCKAVWTLFGIAFLWDWNENWPFPLQVQETLKRLLQHHNSKAPIPQCSGFFMFQVSHSYMTAGKTIALTMHMYTHTHNTHIYLVFGSILGTELLKS